MLSPKIRLVVRDNEYVYMDVMGRVVLYADSFAKLMAYQTYSVFDAMQTLERKECEESRTVLYWLNPFTLSKPQPNVKIYKQRS